MSAKTFFPFAATSVGIALPAALKLAGADHVVRYLLLCEDGLYESVGSWCLLAAALLFARRSTDLLMQRREGSGSLRSILGPAGWSALLFFAFLEEISWGQRLIGLETPVQWSRWSRSGELNVHNLAMFYGEDEHVSLAQWGFIGFSVLTFLAVPSAARRRPSVARLLQSVQWPVPSGTLSLVFAGAILGSVVYVLAFASNAELSDAQQATEVFEAVVEALILALALEACGSTVVGKRGWALMGGLLLAAAAGVMCSNFVDVVWPVGRSVLLISEGNEFLDRGDGVGALRCFEQATKVHPRSAAAWYSLGLAHERLGAVLRAEEYYRTAAEVEPRFADAHNNFGVLLLRRGRLADAAEAFERALKVDPAHARAWENLQSVRSMPR